MGNLSGYAWGENVGWINFKPTGAGVKIDPLTGVFSGKAWGENIGWINFSPNGKGIKTSWRPDADDDGYPFNEDCDDNNPSIYPGAPEVCDGLDNNCNGETDEGNVCDLDKDGILNSIDGYMSGGTFTDESGFASDNFTDIHLGGTTSGNIINRDGLTIQVTDNDSGGVQITASGGVGTAFISVCGFQATFTDGDSATITCGSLTIHVFTGDVNVQVAGNLSVVVPKGLKAIIKDLGDEQYRIENASDSQVPVTITFNGETTELQPGESATFATADRDQDGILDTEDSCPDENATGLDANGDGCIDNIAGLGQFVQTLVDEGLITEQLQNSLLSKVSNAQKSADKENICAAVNQLKAFINEINAQRNKKISDEAADRIISYVNNVIAGMLAQLPSGESC